MMWKRALTHCTKRVTQQSPSWKKWPSPTSLQYAARSMSSTSSAPATSEDVRIASTYNWFHELVIGQKLCPFAPPMDKDPSLMRVISAPEDATKKEAIALVRQQIIELMGEFPDGCPEVVSPEDLPTDAVHETTLVILDLPFLQDFREFVRFSWDLQEEAVAEYVSILQIVLFHPQATHQTYGSSLENAGDYTIRAPYPTVHLLREMDVMRAVQGGYPRLDTLPQRNQQKMIKQGLEHCQQRLEGCYVERKE
eukprot:Nitzschia sp. Nitz4//scaffold147_size54853//36733//37488//NITZ4_006622-RA/size54853-processed-gene-0.57-mRNA-1//-1//CDS//3329536708//9316//frame0